jgi:hypothetical protein
MLFGGVRISNGNILNYAKLSRFEQSAPPPPESCPKGAAPMYVQWASTVSKIHGEGNTQVISNMEACELKKGLEFLLLDDSLSSDR